MRRPRILRLTVRSAIPIAKAIAIGWAGAAIAALLIAAVWQAGIQAVAVADAQADQYPADAGGTYGCIAGD